MKRTKSKKRTPGKLATYHRIVDGQVVAGYAVIVGDRGFLMKSGTSTTARAVKASELYLTAEAALASLKLKRGFVVDEHNGEVVRCLLRVDGLGRRHAVDRKRGYERSGLTFETEAAARKASERIIHKRLDRKLVECRKVGRDLVTATRRRKAAERRERLA